MAPPIEVFYAYAPADETWVQELEKHLSGLQRQGLITTWHPRLIVAGEDWQHVIDARFRSASVILLLISPDFLDSEYCYGAEMRHALAREHEQGVCIIPILLRPVDWAHAPFAHLRPLPSDQRFLTEWTNLDRAFAEVTAGIRRAIENLSVMAASLAHAEGPGIWNVPFPQRHLGPEHPETATSLSDLADIYVSQGRYTPAEPLYQRALALRLQQLGAEHPSTAASVHDLAFLYASQGRMTEAEPLYQQALAIDIQQLGPEHPDTAQVLFNLASLYASQGKTTEAEPLYQQALAIDMQQLGPEHPETQAVQERYTLFLQEKGHDS